NEVRNRPAAARRSHRRAASGARVASDGPQTRLRARLSPYSILLASIISETREDVMPAEDYDAIVVGSGISGGWAGKALTEKGLRVVMLERGKNIEHIKDYVNASKAPWDYPHRGGRTRAMEELYPVLKRDYPLNEKNLDWWASDKDSPYTEVKRFDW